MKKFLILLLIAIIASLYGCNQEFKQENNQNIKDEEVEVCDGIYPLAVMYNGQIYGTTIEIYDSNKQGDELGVILSSIEAYEGMPTEEFSTNHFSVGDVVFAYGNNDNRIGMKTGERYCVLVKKDDEYNTITD